MEESLFKRSSGHRVHLVRRFVAGLETARVLRQLSVLAGKQTKINVIPPLGRKARTRRRSAAAAIFAARTSFWSTAMVL